MIRRLTATLLAASLAAAALTGGQAHAASAPADPVKSLRAQFVQGRGVLVSETSRSKLPGDARTAPTRTTGTIAFGRHGVVGADLTSKYPPSPELDDELQEIEAGRTTYVRGFWWGPLPEGKKWILFNGKNSFWGQAHQRADQVIDVFDPRTLRLLLAKATVRKGGEYRGVVTSKELYKKSELMFVEFSKVSYRLFLDRNWLPIRLVTEYQYTSVGYDKDGNKIKDSYHPLVDTRYSGYGTMVAIAPPPADEVVDFDDLEMPSGEQSGDEPLTLDRNSISAR
ncbi:hypothetical protein HCN51_55510 [Nonomuraea sp. FMUSA5-5]|uniref:Uncharacterized protein n=1 Tax=Nonomuraea composti TaxID=2720023 RepID=A0ABX1BRW6_9ACTN|nr:hypothetical protein [Nonomuraea sp. FMUSA5-5]NJP98536.1 hypothetical protein [Nonomuraea sp. FMUSA5-5]